MENKKAQPWEGIEEPARTGALPTCTRRLMDFITNGFSSKSWPEQVRRGGGGDGGEALEEKGAAVSSTLGITDSACKNQLVVVSVQYGPFNPSQRIMYGPFNPYIPIRSTTIGKSRVAIDPIAMRTSWRSNSDIASVTSIGYPRMSASGESSTTMHRLLHASGHHPIPQPNDPKEHYDILSMQIDSDLVIYRTTLVRTFQVVTICRVDKSEVLVVLISPHDSKRH
ncbi:hypothetical protein F511_05539 [Dorcoceras hygrometricum]|uniref:Uncharacterized protein n=1 Tax=Dorcoceras hygrometricum TaxID=472368 RepID=A0A2Z7BDW1_9LAMI|nr:hypothetical protein F511_05539 [Dorcoceras hygrometricum]